MRVTNKYDTNQTQQVKNLNWWEADLASWLFTRRGGVEFGQIHLVAGRRI